MKLRHLAVIAGAGIVIALIVLLVASAYWERKQTALQNAPKLLAALHSFSHDQTAAGRQLPPEVSLQDLLQGGYLKPNEAGPFQGVDVTFRTHIDDSNPQMILARARMPDGRFICLLADGSVQQLSREGYEQQHTAPGKINSKAAAKAGITNSVP